jgi:hypothetical protein
MKNNIRLYFKINTELYEKIKNEALIQDISIARLCREKIMGCPQLTRIELTMEEIQKKLNTKLNLNRRYKNGNKIA